MLSAHIPSEIGTRDAHSWVSNPSLGAMTGLSLRRRLKYLPMKNDYSGLYDGVRHLANHVRRGILDWQREITALAESGPPSEAASIGLIEQGLKEVATTRFFVKAARAPEWIEWIEK